MTETILLTPPEGGARRRRAAVVSEHGQLAVVEDPFDGGYTIAVPSASKVLTAWRFASAQDAAAAADEVAPLADWDDADAAMEKLAEDRTLAQRVVDAMRTPGSAIAPGTASYPEPERTGQSYTKEYDEKRKQAKREARRKQREAGKKR